MPKPTAQEERVFVYIIGRVGSQYKLTGRVPSIAEGRIFFGPCKKLMRPKMNDGDYVMGISPAQCGERRVLLWMPIAKRMTFAQAYWCGEEDSAFRAARGKAIHVRPIEGLKFTPGCPGCYEHIKGAIHPDDWPEDLLHDRDAFFVGNEQSWIKKGWKRGQPGRGELFFEEDPNRPTAPSSWPNALGRGVYWMVRKKSPRPG
jgi:hypothetical protein